MPQKKKILSIEETIAWRKTLKGKKLVVTNGVYDLLHPGHVDYLTNAREQGDFLLVCCNGDAGVRQFKGPKRPIVDEENRAYMLASLECVDKIVIFEDAEALDTLVQVEPDIYVKGGDYTIDTINQDERRALEEKGADIRILPFRDGFSTTLMIERIIDAYAE
ncbi:MAG: adenylyltransferase/cytidyltransferase family protein [Lentisphaeraceae bacterium]|nr:adenylyltransferase/cytidyltransferase family protein [Lentisphaeraceae bacterium]